MKRFTLAVALAATTLIGGLALADTVSAAATSLCPDNADGYGAKINTTDNPATVTVEADPGMLISGYCVKAGSDTEQSGGGVVFVDVDPPSATVTIDHPTKDSISHYSVKQIPAPTKPDPKADLIVDEYGVCAVGDTSVSGTRTTTGYKVVWENGAWVQVVDEVTKTPISRPLTDSEKTACAPVVPAGNPPTAQLPPAAASEVAALPPVPAAAPPVAQQVSPAAAPAAAPVPTQLPTTGSSSWITFLLALTATGAGFGLLKLSRRPA